MGNHQGPPSGGLAAHVECLGFIVLLWESCLVSEEQMLPSYGKKVHEVCGPGRRSNFFQKMLHVPTCKL